MFNRASALNAFNMTEKTDLITNSMQHFKYTNVFYAKKREKRIITGEQEA